MENINENIEFCVDRECIFGNITELNSSIRSVTGLLIMLVNIRSIDKNFNEFNILLQSLNKSPDLIICTETFELKHPPLYKLEGYDLHYNNSKINRNDGVAIYIKTNIKYKVTIEKVGLTSFISTVIDLDNNIEMKVTGIYRCHDLGIKTLLEDLHKFLRTNKNFSNHILAGDFNIDVNKKDNDSINFLSNFLENEYLPYFQTTTRGNDRGGGSCIDNFFVKTNLTTQAFKLEYNLTDHDPLFFNVRCDI